MVGKQLMVKLQVFHGNGRLIGKGLEQGLILAFKIPAPLVDHPDDTHQFTLQILKGPA